MEKLSKNARRKTLRYNFSKERYFAYLYDSFVNFFYPTEFKHALDFAIMKSGESVFDDFLNYVAINEGAERALEVKREIEKVIEYFARGDFKDHRMLKREKRLLELEVDGEDGKDENDEKDESVRKKAM